MANVNHHANAKNLTIQLTFNGEGILLTVYDNGLGFDVRQSENYSGYFGLPGMRERAELAGSKLSIDGHSGHGATVRLIIRN